MEYPVNFDLSTIITAEKTDWRNVQAENLVLLLPENETPPNFFNENESLSQVVKSLYDRRVFNGKSETLLLIPCASFYTYQNVILAGIGKVEAFTADKQRRIGGLLAKKIQEIKAKTVCLVLPDQLLGSEIVQEFALGCQLASYRFADFKSVKKESENTCKVSIFLNGRENDFSSALKTADEISRGVNLARTLVNLPPNYCTPEIMAGIARKIGEETGLKVSVLDKPAIEAEKMGAFLAVNQGSHHPPQFIIMEHEGEKSDHQETVVLVGKAVTFDTGGYNLKTADGMASMKSDMAGGAAVLGAMLTIGALKPAARVIGLVPATENKISENAYLPQDVITASNGKTIEIISTDAEGRMTLADALVYAERFKPTMVVDIATLTGACVTALGGVAAGLFTSDDELKNRLLSAAEYTNERLWHLPMYEEYQKQIDSPVADLKNSGGRMGGVGSSALFLKHFTNYSWAHIDMAGVSGDVTEKPYNVAKSASGYGVRLFVELVTASNKNS